MMDRNGLLACLVIYALCITGVVGRGANAHAAKYACHEKDQLKYPFCNKSLAIGRRVEVLIASLTADEKLGLLINTAPGIPRLGIPSYQWQNEGLHGVASSPGVSFEGPIFSATSFPQPILTASSFNTTLFNDIGQVISTEARAFHNLGQGGLTYWTPNINVFRDPRWGRGQETPGEDPHLTGVYAEYFVRGLQEDWNYNRNTSSPAPSKLKLSVCCKHFTAYDMDSWDGVERYGFNAVVTQQDLDDTFNPPFQSCIQNGRASGLMCSYNAVNGIPSCADSNLLTVIARDNWGFDGYIVSDCDAVQTIYANQKYADPEHAVADTLQAGMDLNCGAAFSNYSKAALEDRLINEREMDVALARTLTVLFRLGFFDGDPALDEAYGMLGKADVCSDEHQELALEAALQGIVLLKNDYSVLPFARETMTNLAVIGPNANDSLLTMVGNYAGNPCKYVTPLHGLINSGSGATIHHVAGCSSTACNSSTNIEAAVSAAAAADATILVMGLAQAQEREAQDRVALVLPGQQQELVKAVALRAKGPVVVVIMSGGPVDISFARDAQSIGAILWVGYPGQAGGQALAQVIFGDRNPGGKLPMTWYPEAFTSWPMTTMNMRPNASSGYPGRTYRFYTGDTVYKFGDGLSYSTFVHSMNHGEEHSRVSLRALVAPTADQLQCYNNVGKNEKGRRGSDCAVQSCSALDFTVEVEIKNTHWRAGSDVVLLYAITPGAGNRGLPLKHLIGFQRVHVAGHHAAKVEFLVQPCTDFVTIQTDGTMALLEGVYTLSVNDGEAQLSVEVRT